MGNVQLQKKKVTFADCIPLDRYEELITRFRLLKKCVKQLEQNKDDVNLKNKFAVMAKQYIENGHANINVTTEDKHIERLKYVLEKIETFIPEQQNLTQVQSTARALMFRERELCRRES